MSFGNLLTIHLKKVFMKKKILNFDSFFHFFHKSGVKTILK